MPLSSLLSLSSLTRAAVLALLTLGLAPAQDFAAIERRLGGAVADGEITLDQARVMLDALKQHAKKTASKIDTDDRAAKYEAAEKRVKLAIERGEVSEKAGYQRLAAYEDRLYGNPDAPPTSDRAPEQDRRRALLMRLREAVARGELSEEEAKKKVAALQGAPRSDRAPAEQRTSRARYAALEERLKKAVAQRQISEEDALERLKEARAAMFTARAPARDRSPAGDRAASQDVDIEARKKRYEALEARLRSMLEKGQITEDQMRQRLEAARRAIFPERASDRRRDLE